MSLLPYQTHQWITLFQAPIGHQLESAPFALGCVRYLRLARPLQEGVGCRMDEGGFDLVILDGEATPAGGMGIAKQLKDEIADCPPILVLTGRADDKWLASWSRADAAVPHPIDPIRLGDAVVSLLRAPVQ